MFGWKLEPKPGGGGIVEMEMEKLMKIDQRVALKYLNM
jgi:hypothetical protein